jgi:GNAT superfamily N-acetyltransferase
MISDIATESFIISKEVRRCEAQDDVVVCNLFRRVWRSSGGTVWSSLCSVGGLAALALTTVLIDRALTRHDETSQPGQPAGSPSVLLLFRLLAPLAAAVPVVAALAFRSVRSQQRYIRKSMHALRNVYEYCRSPSTKGLGYMKTCWVFPGHNEDSIAGVVVLHGNEIEFLFVDAAARRKGVAKALLKGAEESCRTAVLQQTGALAFSSIQLTVTAAQPDAMSFCESYTVYDI